MRGFLISGVAIRDGRIEIDTSEDLERERYISRNR